MATNQNRIPNDGVCIQKKSPISSGSSYDVGDTTVIISMTPFIGSRTPTNFTSLAKKGSLSSKSSKYSASAPAFSHFKSTKTSSKSTLTSVESTASNSNIALIGKQHLAKMEMGLKCRNKAKSFKSVLTESPRLLPLNRDLYVRSSSVSIERGSYDHGLKSKDASNLSRNKPRISLKSSNTSAGKISKLEAPRWIQGVLVKDMGNYYLYKAKELRLQNILKRLISHFLLNHVNLKKPMTLKKRMKRTF
jgi:hypothetical protein